MNNNLPMALYAAGVAIAIAAACLQQSPPVSSYHEPHDVGTITTADPWCDQCTRCLVNEYGWRCEDDDTLLCVNCFASNQDKYKSWVVCPVTRP